MFDSRSQGDVLFDSFPSGFLDNISSNPQYFFKLSDAGSSLILGSQRDVLFDSFPSGFLNNISANPQYFFKLSDAGSSLILNPSQNLIPCFYFHRW